DLFREFTADVEANPTEPAALHALRIAGKRLRYALEIFADCFPPAMKETVYPAVEHVQEMLGDVQDAIVGLERLAEIRATVGAGEGFCFARRGKQQARNPATGALLHPASVRNSSERMRRMGGR